MGTQTWIGAALTGFALMAAGVVALLLFFSPSNVELTVDGATQSISTRAGSVGELLAEEGIEVGPTDRVEPSPEAELVDGGSVEVRFARPVTIVVDGVETTHAMTDLTVGDALQTAGAPLDGAAISLPLDQPVARSGATVSIITPKSVTVSVDGITSTVVSTDASVGDLLETTGVVLGPTDVVAPDAATPVSEAMAVTVTRIRVETEVRTEVIAHDTIERNDADRTVGNRAVEVAGVDGEQQVTYAVTYTDGQVTAEEVTDVQVVREPVAEVVVVGTKPVPIPAGAAGGEAAGLNWAALADCESSGNPRAVNPAGYYGLYQFSLPTWASVGGSGNPIDASPEEQTTRAQILYNRSGAGQWPHCGPRLFS